MDIGSSKEAVVDHRCPGSGESISISELVKCVFQVSDKIMWVFKTD